MSAYMIVLNKVTQEEGWAEYRRRVAECFGSHGGVLAARGGPTEVKALEGAFNHDRVIVFRFPSMEALTAAWNSSEYAQVRKLREGLGFLDVLAVPGAP